ncbi:glycosyltransferase [Paenibacillus sp. 22594]|uniref:glycosyltransferase n=1 Tax=Paenibacillus sp. 22594 TaxID=3453947 RepID=UPI003F8658D3
MRDQYLISIIIPTKNREKYAYKAVEQILQIDDERIQVVVQDNSDTRKLEELLHRFKENKRLKYNYTEGIVSFVDNFSIAVSLADGEYLCLIGDDDGIVPQIIGVVEWAKKNNVDAIKPELNAVFFWPHSEALKESIDNGYLNITKITSKAEWCNPLSEVEKLLNQGAQRYLYLDMVKLYHGIVRKSCLENIKILTGRYFGGLSPDIYISVALSLTVKNLVKIDFPLTISGICSKSGSADSATGRHTGRLVDAPHFRGQKNYEWSKLVPEFYSVETIWADSALAAIKDLDKEELINKFNIGILLFNCLKKYPQFENIITEHSNSFAKNELSIRYTYYCSNIIEISKKVLNKLTNRSLRINGVDNIIEANNFLQQRINKINIDNNKIQQSLDKLIGKL